MCEIRTLANISEYCAPINARASTQQACKVQKLTATLVKELRADDATE
jgi:hypothetical protein